jgi:hypothetical protein
MGTMLEEYTTEEQHSVGRFLSWTKVLNAKDIHKEMFPDYGGKCFSCKAVHNLLPINFYICSIYKEIF